jgi:hypothetical protein
MCINQVKRNVMNQKRIYDKLKETANHFPKYRTKILLGDFNVKVGKGIIPNRQMGMTTYISIVMTMVLE